ncbi:MAG: hypothetical protein ABR506_11985 [Candidatus Krumholzibacteriia bacterium]
MLLMVDPLPQAIVLENELGGILELPIRLEESAKLVLRVAKRLCGFSKALLDEPALYGGVRLARFQIEEVDQLD